MISFLTTMVCALGLSAGIITSPADPVNEYIINGNRVENFNGSQLKGKVIEDYTISVAGDKHIHNITTKESAPEPIYVVNGKKVPKDLVNSISPADIKSMTVLKNATQPEAAKYNGGTNASVILIVTKKPVMLEL